MIDTPKMSTIETYKKRQDLKVGLDSMEAILQEDDKKQSSSLNYSPSEDLCLCKGKAYVSASCDSVHGTYQEQSTFLGAIRTKVFQLHENDEIVEVKTPDFDPATRSSDRLMFRFNKTITPDVRRSTNSTRIKEKEHQLHEAKYLQKKKHQTRLEYAAEKVIVTEGSVYASTGKQEKVMMLLDDLEAMDLLESSTQDSD